MPKKKTGNKEVTDKEKGKEPDKVVDPGKIEEPEKTEPEEEKANEPEKKNEKSTKELVNEACKELNISKDDIAKVDREGDEIVIELKPPESRKIKYPS